MTDEGRGRVFEILCPHCGAVGEFKGSFEADMVILCGGCGEDVTETFKQAYFEDVTAHINARMVEKENQEFFSYLATGWRMDHDTGGDSDPADHA